MTKEELEELLIERDKEIVLLRNQNYNYNMELNTIKTDKSNWQEVAYNISLALANSK